MFNRQQKEYQIELFLSRAQRLYNTILDLKSSGISITNLEQKSNMLDLLQTFPNYLRNESLTMSECYQIVYCFENDLREIIRTVMQDNKGDEWWNTIQTKIKEEVERNRKAEEDSVYHGRNNDPLYFTNLSQLKDIIIQNYEYFDNHFRSESFVKKLLTEINRLRITIAHNLAMEKMDIEQLTDHIIRWYTIKINTQ